jgi:molybdopterin-guanine dinucleotide biosynthesis protein A
MGSDKAFVEVNGRPMVRHVADALTGAGCELVIAVGGDRPGLEGVGLEVVDDRWPGAGPLGGVVTALEAAAERGARTVLVVGCDTPFVSTRSLRRLLDAAAADQVDVALATTGRDEPLCAAWNTSCRSVLRASFDAGERAVHRAIARWSVVRVPVEPAELHNVNRPDDLIGL